MITLNAIDTHVKLQSDLSITTSIVLIGSVELINHVYSFLTVSTQIEDIIFENFTL